jgi:aminotransferase
METKTTAFAARTRSFVEGGLAGLLGEGHRLGAIDLAAGTPREPTPPGALIEAAGLAMRAGRNQYENPAGNQELRALVAASLPGSVNPDTEITITVGATEGLCVALLSTVDPGDEVIVLEPFYDNFAGAVGLAGGQLRTVPLRPSEWRFDTTELAAAFGPRTRAIILNTPHNPTGRVLDRAELTQIGELCERWNCTLICDEVYATFVYGGRRHLSPADLPELSERSIIVGSLSKSHAISGWRLGYLRATPRYTQVLRQVHVATTGGAAAPLQHAVLSTDLLTVSRWNPAPIMEKRAGQMVELVRAAGLRTDLPEGGCYVMADIRQVTDEGGEIFAGRMLREAGVLVAPGAYFYRNQADGASFVRFAFNRTQEVLAAAEDRLAGFGRHT